MERNKPSPIEPPCSFISAPCSLTDADEPGAISTQPEPPIQEQQLELVDDEKEQCGEPPKSKKQKKQKTKFYAVACGRNPGIYSCWRECQKQVTKYPGAAYKHFDDSTEAEKWMDSQKTAPIAEEAASQSPTSQEHYAPDGAN